jgi:hypothetical protein
VVLVSASKAWPVSQSMKRGPIFLGGVKRVGCDAGHKTMAKPELAGANVLSGVRVILIGVR